MSGAVVVVGSVNVDLVVRVPRLPGPGETVIGGRFHRAAGGKGANQAAAAARLGAPTWFVGLVGQDDLGREARADLEAAGVDVGLLGPGEEPTGVAAILVDASGENLIAVASGANAELGAEHVEAAMRRIDVGNAVVLSNLEVPDEAVAAAASAAGERGWPFVLNPAPARALPEEVVALATVLVPNETEVAQLGGPDALLDGGATAVLVTLGSRGAALHRPGASPRHVPAFPVDAVDTTGAGDAFCGALAWALAAGWDLEEAARLAAGAGALACRAVGARASLPAAEELEGFIEDRRGTGPG